MTATYLFKFKLLNGPLAGRELGLPEGELRLGGDDPDLAVPLEQGATATLNISEEGVQLLTPTPVWVDGAPWDTDTSLPSGKVIDLAGQAFIFGDPDAELESQTVPDRVVPVIAKKKPWLAVTMVMIVLCSAGLAFTVLQLAETTAVFDPEQWLAAQLRTPTFKGLEVKKNSMGALVLSGHCTHSSQLDALRTMLRAHGLLIHNEAVCQDTLQRNVRYILELNGYRDFQILPGETLGSVEIRGAIRADSQWQQAAKQLNELAGMKSWKVINNDKQIFQSLLAKLNEKSLLDGLSVVLDSGNLLVTGQIDTARANAVAEVLASFNKSAPSRLRASFQNIPSAALPSKLLPAPVVSLGGNATDLYVELANGMRLQQGSVLPSGYTVYALTTKSISFLKDESLIYLPLNL